MANATLFAKYSPKLKFHISLLTNLALHTFKFLSQPFILSPMNL